MIRPFTAADTPAAIRILQEVFAEYAMAFDPEGFDKDVHALHERYPAPDAVFLAAEDEGELVGFVGADWDPRSRRAELHRLYLARKARGRGLGRTLCRAAEEWATLKGAGVMELWSDTRFTHAHTLYYSLGYRIHGARDLTDPDRSVELGMERSLNPDSTAPPPDPLLPSFRAALKQVSPTLWRARPEMVHRCAMTAQAILDRRGPADPREIVPGNPGTDPEMIATPDFHCLGFRFLGVDFWHPSAKLKA